MTRLTVLRDALADALDRHDANDVEAASALGCFLLDILVDVKASGDSKVSGEMRRVAERLTMLADATPQQVAAVALAMADHAPGVPRI